MTTNTRDFDEFFLSKVAFQAGHRDVYIKKCGPKTEIATPSKWITDDTLVAHFAFDNGMERIESPSGDVFRLAGEALQKFLIDYEKEIKKAEKMSVDELLKDYKVLQFLSELEDLSKKHGLWIEKSEKAGTVDLVDDSIQTVATDLHFDGEVQMYVVNDTLKVTN